MFICCPMKNLSRFDIFFDRYSLTCHFSFPGKRKQNCLLAFCFHFLKNPFHNENGQIGEQNPAGDYDQICPDEKYLPYALVIIYDKGFFLDSSVSPSVSQFVRCSPPS